MGERIREWSKGLIAVAIGLIIAFILVEVLLRVLPIQKAYVRIPRKANDAVGFTRHPNTEGRFAAACYKTTDIRFNSSGFRDADFAKGKDFTTAILGDSFMEALEVPQNANTAAILEGLLDTTVLNGGLTTYGNVTQLFVYREFFEQYKPKVVVLFFYTENDVKDNSCELTRMYGESIIQPCGVIENGNVQFKQEYDAAGPRDPNTIKNFLRQNCVTCLFLYRTLKYDIGQKAEHGDIPFLFNVFRHDPPPEYRDAFRNGWTITEAALKQLNREIEEIGGKLLIAVVPSYYGVVHDWQKYFKEATGVPKVPDDYDPWLGEKKIEAFGKQNNIPVLLLADTFREYRDRLKLKDPYLWYFCDGHWSPVGHFIAANAVTEKLLTENMLPVDETRKIELEQQVQQNLKRSPKEILGEKAYDQIYNRGVYTGSTNLPALLK